MLVDARHGLTEQSRRHAVILSLLRVPHLVLAVNKMDLVDYDQATFDRIQKESSSFATKLSIPDLTVIPISALKGDNVVHRSEHMPWYNGSSLMHHLENVHVASDRDPVDTRIPVQYVVRPTSDDFHASRGYAAMVAAGTQPDGRRRVRSRTDQITRLGGSRWLLGSAPRVVAGPCGVSWCFAPRVGAVPGGVPCRFALRVGAEHSGGIEVLLDR